MSTHAITGTRRRGTPAHLLVPVTAVLVAALLTACDSNARASGSSTSSESATTAGPSPDPSPSPMSQRRLDKLDTFLDKVEFVDRVGPEFELRDVDYTSPTDAVAHFLHARIAPVDLGSIIATTDDNWAHSARVRISWDLADLVDYVPLGQGAVAIKAQDQFPRRSYPPFVLYPDGEVKPLRVGEPRALESDHEVLGMGVDNLFGLFAELPAGCGRQTSTPRRSSRPPGRCRPTVTSVSTSPAGAAP